MIGLCLHEAYVSVLFSINTLIKILFDKYQNHNSFLAFQDQTNNEKVQQAETINEVSSCKKCDTTEHENAHAQCALKMEK